MALNFSRGRRQRGVKTVIYGPEGIGKTSLAAQMPNPVFFDTEHGSDSMDVVRADGVETWADLIAAIDELTEMPDEAVKTIVIDTADRAEQWCTDFVLKKYGQTSIEGFGYGKGYTYLAEAWSDLLIRLERAAIRGKHTVLIAHAQMRKFEQPDEMGAYDRWELKLSKKIAPITKEWADLLLFLNYKTNVVTTGAMNQTKKVIGGKRVMYTAHHPCWDAKNRHSLPDEMPLDYDGIRHLFEKKEEPPVTQATREEIENKIIEAGIERSELLEVMGRKAGKAADAPLYQYSEEFCSGWVLPNWDRIVKLIEDNRGGNES